MKHNTFKIVSDTAVTTRADRRRAAKKAAKKAEKAKAVKESNKGYPPDAGTIDAWSGR